MKFSVFDSVRKYKKIVVAAVLAVIAVVILCNLKFSSVAQHDKQAADTAALMEENALDTDKDASDSGEKEQESVLSEDETDGSQAESSSDEKVESQGSKDDEKNTENSNVSADNPDVKEGSNADNNSDITANSAKPADSSQSGMNIQNAGSEKKETENSKTTDNNSQNTVASLNAVASQKAKVKCTIQIRCDNASKRKSQIDNPTIKNYIPDNGVILPVTSYTGDEGCTVYDVLKDVTTAKNIPMVSGSTGYGTYVRSINNLSEKMVGKWSGWTYRVNGELIMSSASSCIIKNGDAIKWIYVCDPEDQ